MIKRLIAAVTVAGATVTGVAAAATGPAQAGVRPHTTKPTITVSETTNLVSGERVTVTGAGWQPTVGTTKRAVAVAECNADGAAGTNYTQLCDIINISVPVTTSGTFSTAINIATGQMNPASSNTYPTLSHCPQSSLQASDGVACILAAADLATKETAYVPLFFKVQPTDFTFTSSQITVNGKKEWEVKFDNAGAYEPVSKGSAINRGGFAVIGTYTNAGKTTTHCQGTTKAGVTWGIGLPACNGVKGEPVQVYMDGKLLGTLHTRTANTVAGEIIHTYKGIVPGDHLFKFVGTKSGQIVRVTVKVGK